MYSYGYFYKETNPKNGTYIRLPNGHDENARAKAAFDKGIEWDMCMFFYNNGGDTYFTNNYGNDKAAKAIDKEGKSFYNIDINTFHKEKTGVIVIPLFSRAVPFKELFVVKDKNIVPLRDLDIAGKKFFKNMVMQETLFGELDLNKHQEDYTFILTNKNDGWYLDNFFKNR